MTDFKNYLIEDGFLENREITVTGKRQITIPKSFFDRLTIDKTLVAYLTHDGIFLKPMKKAETIQDDDMKNIIRQVISEGYTDEEMVEEIAFRVGEYNKFIDRRIQEWENDIRGESVSEEPEENYNGLDIFFNAEAGEVN